MESLKQTTEVQLVPFNKSFLETIWKSGFQQTIQRGRSLTRRILMTIASLMMRKVLEQARLRTF